MARTELTAFPYTLMPRIGPGNRESATQREAYVRRFTVMGDPPADALVTLFARCPPGEGRRLFEHALAHGIDAVPDPPHELSDFFLQLDIPFWVDTDQLDQGARVIARTGVIGLAALSMGGLLGGYAAHRVTKPLTITGDLERMAAQRIAETTYWFVAATAQGGLTPHAPGWQATLRVRLMHALVRAGMARRPEWQWDAWDSPLNQSQMAGTVTIFATAILSGSQALGMRFSRRERDAVYHVFRCVGWLLGVDPRILPADEHDYARLLHLQAVHEFDGPDQDSHRLAQALIESIGPLTAGAADDLWSRIARVAATGVLCAYGRRILGSSDANYLGLPDNTLLQRGVGGAATAIRCLELVRCVIPGATRFAETYGRHSRTVTAQRMMLQHSGNHRYIRHDPLSARAQDPLAPRPASSGQVKPLTPSVFLPSSRQPGQHT